MKLDKNKIKYGLIKYPRVFNLYRYIYTLMFHRERLMRKCSYGELNPELNILIIRPSSEDQIQGLMSLFIQTLRWIDYSDHHNCIPVVDYQNFRTQYYTSGINVWEWFFHQPSELSLADAYSSKNVEFTGVSRNDKVNGRLFREEVFRNSGMLAYCSSIIERHISLSEEAMELIESENQILHIEEAIGVYIRGTDYAKLKPAGEFRQPHIDEVVEKIKEFIGKYPGKKLFLVTEDAQYHKRLQKEFSELLLTVSFDTFISDYDGRSYLGRTSLLNEDKKRRGMDYLVKIILLSRCRYLISSVTMGSIAAYCFNGGKYEDEYIFELGYYE